MSDQICLLSDQNGALVGHMSFQEEKIICSPAYTTTIDQHYLLSLIFMRLNLRDFCDLKDFANLIPMKKRCCWN